MLIVASTRAVSSGAGAGKDPGPLGRLPAAIVKLAPGGAGHLLPAFDQPRDPRRFELCRVDGRALRLAARLTGETPSPRF